ncbi:ABC transporter substrate-binding protein [Robbsia andropogonis]|uniref:ABC transporter substrate-binding protein n=1 Tax=Robbsia andropogonis TaxID=28092 RepID=UPI0004639C78|nr:ABC transporter substrate-binding protein [Robbsia andropogonis]MCP1116911.1 ABC transporter substrate-binding protein [Robbsia andropogonis]MCP1126410.1 ABC transporter substrate-binding protein [Robbsia andropogonis]
MKVSKLLGSMLLGLALPFVAHAQSCVPKFASDHLVKAGELQMSINPTLPPQQYVNDKGELEGLNVELGNAIAKSLCLKPTYLRMDMPPMIPALKTGRFDAIDTGLFWTEERSKMFYMVPYAQQAISIYTLPGSKLVIHGFDDLAGRKVGVEIGTYQERKARGISDDMVKRGLQPIQFLTFETVTDTSQALLAGQVEAGLNIDETARSLEDRKLVKVWVRGQQGTDITFAFRDKVVAQAAADAITKLKADGTYDKLFAKFRMTPLKETTFSIRGTGPN